MTVSLYMDTTSPKRLRLACVCVMWMYLQPMKMAQTNSKMIFYSSERMNLIGRSLHKIDDLLEEAAKCQRESVPFSGVIYGHQLRVAIGICIQDLEIIAKNGEPKDLENQVLFLPL